MEAGRLPVISMRTWSIAAVTGAGAFMAMLDATVANLAIESIRRDLDVPLAMVQWVATGYLVALAVSLPVAGWLGNRYGYGRLWGFAMALFILSSAGCALAPNIGSLIGARLVQGLAAGVMVPAGQAVIGSIVSAQQLGRVMGTLGLVIALGPAIGPGLGGMMLEVLSWRWLFWINVPVGLVALLAARRLVPGGDTTQARPLDGPGLLLIGVGLPMMLYGATRLGAQEAGLTSLGTVLLGGVMVASFVWRAGHQPHPLIDVRLLHARHFAAATLTAGLAGANMYGGLLVLPLYLQTTAELGAASTGAQLLAMGLGSALMLPLAGTLTDRLEASCVAMGGAALMALATLPLALGITFDDVGLALLLAVRGAGLALTQMPAMTAAYASATRAQMGDATTIVNVVQRAGGALGAIVVVIILSRVGSRAGSEGHAMAFVMLMMLAVAAMGSAVAMRSRRAVA
ncbi:DHA2 family efflux MFS transporter permease subunit [Halomonas caseinilytica]|uniref:DHA2 family efflux MFS transporter permease subunit n=1 Tax=Halomonas caseinilytica TaxID=438744 RepID=UPI0007E53D8D|nr:DHA2 family efflux MFS transporter permease subunit [Halomonas caseinilytica]SEM37312.1 drug resistance transporter, EmrB/QacA subfamily [Halomonas caseinilytica]